MKQAKFALTAVAVLAVIGGALAFKANRNLNTFYKYGTTTIAGAQVTGCVVSTRLQYSAAPLDGVTTIPYSVTTFSTLADVCTARVNPNI